MATLLDLVLLMVISKEAILLESVIPPALWITYVVGLPYFLGMATSLREKPGLVRNWVRAAIAQGVTVASLILFVDMLSYRGLEPAFWSTLLFAGIAYGMGRLFGLTLKALLALLVVVAIVILLLQRTVR